MWEAGDWRFGTVRVGRFGFPRSEYLPQPFRVCSGQALESRCECAEYTASTRREKGSALEGASRHVYKAGLKPCPSGEPAPSLCAQAWSGAGR